MHFKFYRHLSFTENMRVSLAIPGAFIICFIIAAIYLQVTSPIPPWRDGTPLEYFTGGLLWMLGMFCMLNALHIARAGGISLFWLAGCVVLSLLAIDEAMRAHEWVEQNWYLNDDYFKIALWTVTPIILYIVYKKIQPSPFLKFIFICGYIIQTLYMFFEVSDGEFYIVDFLHPIDAKWGEEICELFFLSAYWLGFCAFYQMSAKSRAEEQFTLLLAFLALRPGEVQPREKLASLLWSDRGDEQARHSLRDALSGLRNALGDAEPSPLVADRETVNLDPAAVEVDAVGFERLVASGTREALKKACALYRGELLEGESIRDPPFEEWLFYERGKLRDLALSVFERLLTYEREAGELEKAVETAKRLLDLNPSHEKTHRTLMRLYADQGRRAAALEQYEHCRAALKRELDVELGPETEELYREILERKGEAPAKATAPAAVLKQSLRPWAAIGGTAIALVAVIAVAVWQLSPATDEAPAFELPDKPSIAVLPFKNLGHPEHENFVDAFTEEIITGLSRYRNLFVIASNSAFAYKGKAAKVQDVGHELGVQYVLEGSVRREADRLRVTAQLVDAITGHHVWAESYERDAEDVFTMQNEVTEEIVATVGSDDMGQVLRAELERAKRKPTESLEAYDYFLLALEHQNRMTKEDNAISLDLFEKAIELDPKFAQAHAVKAWSYIRDSWYGWSDSSVESAELALQSAEKGVALDPNDARNRLALGAVYLYMKQQQDKARAQWEKALDLNPNYADVMTSLGELLSYIGRPDEGIEWIERALRLNPHHPGWYDVSLGIASYGARQYEEAIGALQRYQNHTAGSWAFLAASYAQLGRIEEAQGPAAEALKLDPEFSLQAWTEILPYKYQDDRDHFIEGMRKAGLPE